MGSIEINGKLVDDPINYQKMVNNRSQIAIDERREEAEQARKKELKRQHTPIVHSERKIGRNEPCPCGSGLKYKKCHIGK